MYHPRTHNRQAKCVPEAIKEEGVLFDLAASPLTISMHMPEVHVHLLLEASVA